MATTATNGTIEAVKEIHTWIEDAVSVARENGDRAEFTVQHYDDTLQLAISILDAETEEPRDEPFKFSLGEAKHLGALLNRPAVVALLDAAE